MLKWKQSLQSYSLKWTETKDQDGCHLGCTTSLTFERNLPMVNRNLSRYNEINPYSHFPLNERKPKIQMAAILAIHDVWRCWITNHAISHTWRVFMIKRYLLRAAIFLEPLRTDGHTHGRTHGQVQNSIPTTNSLAGGIIKSKHKQMNLLTVKSSVPDGTMYLFLSIENKVR